MKILHIQYGMSPSGNAAFRLHVAMRNRGIDSSVLTLTSTVERSHVINFPETMLHKTVRVGVQRIHAVFSRVRLVSNHYHYHEMPLLGCEVYKHPLVKEADVIYLHWIADGASAKDIRRILSLGKPVVVFLHDMWMITGGCHHSFDCKQYASGCADCNMFVAGRSVARQQLRNKAKLFAVYDNVCFVSPSRWLMDCASRSLVTKGKRVLQIPNLVDETVFKPMDKDVARRILNLPQDKFIITFGCQSGVNNVSKGWKYFCDAVSQLPYDREEIMLLIYGSDYDEEVQKSVKYPVQFLGPVWDEYKLVLINNASSVFVSPSLCESFGLSLLENILCNTPVISFNNTAIPEIVVAGQTGYLAHNKDVGDLRNGLEHMIDYRLEEVRSKCNYSSEQVLEQHLRLIQSIS